ncbi:hypothetical protein QRO08_22530 [Paracidovorax citrulli]|uniref:Uncharacterized protein n=3 Tax=Paracidovorax citrulli TaxID=80869 RepID=A1TJE9_PARC0|nr:hypothetical protein [Paracidovorax citrulli]ABM31087.1 hypothetical protein Aave_0480 [Paracidovorax citrulli AAC00-1]ATG95762.1 hypothetical protein CQB05_18435 [Paracidovorax citrulli]MVT37945.1 hypothetical protein [Paracidovorax citrulli]PVY65269.1 hypothetical protein C8E08_2622 [Paracidovorax citrulli]REG70541.1 hypothetical protein C8E07_3753 [Paracidovorax citrulli]
MSAIKKAFQAIGKGIEKAVHSVGQIAKGIVTLNLKAAAEGLKGLADATMTMARGAMNLMPAAMAANTLLDGALDKMLRKVQNSAQKLADSVVDSVEGGLSNIKDGVVNTAKGIARGNFSKAFKGLTQLAMGVVDTASNFGPGGVAKNMARMAVDAAIGLAGQEATKLAAKVLDPHGTSRFGALATDMVGAAVGGGLGGSRAGRFAGCGTGATGMLQGAKHAVQDTARTAALGFAQEQVSTLTLKVQMTLDPDGDSRAGEAGANAFDSAANAALFQATAGRRRADGTRATAGEHLRGVQGAATDAALNSLNFSAQTAVQGAIYEQLSPLGAGTGTGLGSSLGAIGTDAAAGVAGAAVNHAFTGRQRGLDGAVQPMAPSTALAATKGAILLAVDQFVQQVIARTILEAIQSTLGQLDAASLKGFASLSEAPDTTDAPTGQGPAEMARRAAAHIRQQMGLSIEMAIDQATRQATEAIGQRLLQGLAGGGNNARALGGDLAAITRNAAMQPIEQASRSVFDAVQGAIGVAARQTVEQGLADKLPLGGSSTAATLQVQIEAQISHYQIRA